MSNEEKLQRLRRHFERTLVEPDALQDLARILELTTHTSAGRHLRLDPSLARGLSYYTGTIMEISVPDLAGSLGGGGRYDNLIGTFLGTEIPACGFSLGLERILVVMQERSMFPPSVENAAVDLVIAALEEGAQADAIAAATAARLVRGLRVDLYPDVAKKMDKVFRYVDQRKARFLAIIGGDEVAHREPSLCVKSRPENKRRFRVGNSPITCQLD